MLNSDASSQCILSTSFELREFEHKSVESSDVDDVLCDDLVPGCAGG
jgi:hypothetical protein